MQLESFSYSQYVGLPKEWRIDALHLGKINLLVGKNASGKSRTLNVITYIARLITKCKLTQNTFESGEFNCIFKEGQDAYSYSVVFQNFKVASESFKKNGKELLNRGTNGIGRIYVEKTGEFQDFQTPTDQLAVVSRQDSLQHPFFEPIHKWASGVRYYQFGTSLGKDHVAIVTKDAPPNDDQWDPTAAAIRLFRKGDKKHPNEFKASIINDLNRLNYEITDIGTDVPQSIKIEIKEGGPIVYLYVQEKRLKTRTEQHDMSQGMFRAVSIIIQLNYAELSQNPSCIVIDDIGEGLDYERSCALIALLTEKAEASNIQLIMSTNDRFIMNAVPLENWTIVQSDSGRSRFFNHQNSKDIFDDFKYTGLNNFDFFSTNFVNHKEIAK